MIFKQTGGITATGRNSRAKIQIPETIRRLFRGKTQIQNWQGTG
jgi:hypothetical protein